MRKFIISILCFLAFPIIMLAALYLITDPFRCIHTFDMGNVDGTNREYLSTELYLHNQDSIHYDSFIFASSRGCGINVYQWNQYLDSCSQPFLFQAWAETLTGEYLKLKFLDQSGVKVRNALVLLDIPSSFSKEQLSHEALSMKHFVFTGGNRLTYNLWQFYNYVQKPSSWISSIRQINVRKPYSSDPVTNDWDAAAKYTFNVLLPQDSLSGCSETTRRTFYAQAVSFDTASCMISAPLINEYYEQILLEMKTIFDAHSTNYHIVLSPAICYTNPAINSDDLSLLQSIFGENKVYDYTGVNPYTIDPNDYSDPNHFGRRIGYLILTDIYEKR